MLQAFLLTIDPILMLFLCIIIGFALRAANVLPKDAGKVMAKLITWVFYPALSFTTMANYCTVDKLGKNITYILLCCFGVAIALSIAIPLARLLTKKKPSEKGVYEYSLAFANSAYMGDPLVMALFGDLIDLFFRNTGKIVKLLAYELAELLTADVNEGSEMRKANALTAVLAGGNLRDDLCCDVAGSGEAVRLFDHGAADNGAVLKHILQVDEVAVVHMLSEIVRVVEVDDALLVCGNDFLGKKDSLCDILADLTCHIVTLNAVDSGVFVGVFLLDLLVVAFDEAHDLLVRGVGLTDQRTVITVCNVGSRNIEGSLIHDLVFDHVLNFFYAERAMYVERRAFDVLRDTFDLYGSHAGTGDNAVIGFGDGNDDLSGIENSFRAVSLDNFH